jgi:dihydrofolate reductase
MTPKLIISEHVSLDGYMAGPKGEMNWIAHNPELFDFVGQLTDHADTALYGRKTYEMMKAYWPTAGDKPGAGKHEKEHSAWYNRVNKYVLSNTMQGQESSLTHFINGDLPKAIAAIKQQSRSSILLFGSPSAVHSLLADNLVDEFYLFVNPVLLGEGIPLFRHIQQMTKLKLVDQRVFDNIEVVGIHYTVK